MYKGGEYLKEEKNKTPKEGTPVAETKPIANPYLQMVVGKKSVGKREHPSKWVTVEGKPNTSLYEAIALLEKVGVDKKATVSNFILGLAESIQAEAKAASEAKSTPHK